MMTPTLWKKTWRDLRASWAQSVALIIIVALGVTSLVALTGAYRDLGTSYHHTYETLHFADLTVRVQSAPADVAAEVAQVEGVRAVTARLVVDTGYLLPDGEPIRARLIGIPAAGQPAVNRVHMIAGDDLSPDDPNGVLVESRFAEVYDLHPGDTVTPILLGKEQKFAVRGIAASPEYLIVSPSRQDLLPSARTFGVFFLPLKTLQRLTNAEGEVNEFCLLLTPDADRQSVLRDVQTVLQPYHVETATWQADQPSNAALHLDLEGYREMGETIPALILIVAAFSLYIMLGRLVRSQRTQIGLMKALGYSNRAVTAHYIALATLIGVVGAVLGAGFGTLAASGITRAYADELGIPLVQTRTYPDLMVIGLVISLVAAALAAWAPARHGAHMRPAQAMRLDPAEALTRGRRSWMESLLPAAAPLSVRLPLRNVFRARGRAVGTGLSVVFAFVLVLFSWGMLDSMDYMLNRAFNDVERWDLMAVFDRPQTEAVVKQVKGWQGVKEVVPAVVFPATLKANGEQKDVLLYALPLNQDVHRWQLEGGATPEEALRDGGILLTPPLAQALGVKVGDTVRVRTPFGEKQVVVRALSSEIYGSTAAMSLGTAEKWVGAPMPMFNALYVRADPARIAELKKALFHLPGAASVQVRSATVREWRSYINLFYVFMGFIIAFTVGMAFAVLFNTMTVNVLERQRELATMRAIGTPVSLIGRMTALESVVLWLLALVPGLLLGWYTTVALVRGFSTDLFWMTAYIAPRGYIITALGILLTMLLAARPAIRRIARLNLAEATKMLT